MPQPCPNPDSEAPFPKIPAPENSAPETPENPPGRRARLWTPGADHPLTEEFLALLEATDGTGTEAEAESVGPWVVRPSRGGYAVYREWEASSKPRLDLPPAGWFHERPCALLYAAVLASMCREMRFRLNPEPRSDGFVLEALHGASWVQPAGRIPMHQPEVAEALQLADSIARSPHALASLMEAAGPTALGLSLDLLGRRLVERTEHAAEEVAPAAASEPR